MVSWDLLDWGVKRESLVLNVNSHSVFNDNAWEHSNRTRILSSSHTTYI